MHASPVVIFALSALAIVPLSGYLGRATEEIAAYTGPTLGGLLNATLGNLAELIIAHSGAARRSGRPGEGVDHRIDSRQSAPRARRGATGGRAAPQDAALQRRARGAEHLAARHRGDRAGRSRRSITATHVDPTRALTRARVGGRRGPADRGLCAVARCTRWERTDRCSASRARSRAKRTREAHGGRWSLTRAVAVLLVSAGAWAGCRRSSSARPRRRSSTSDSPRCSSGSSSCRSSATPPSTARP